MLGKLIMTKLNVDVTFLRIRRVNSIKLPYKREAEFEARVVHASWEERRMTFRLS